MRTSSASARALGSFALACLLGGAALLLGLAGATLRTGQLDPLDWLLPGAGAIMLLSATARRSNAPMTWRSAAWNWAMAAVPPLLLILIAASRVPWGLSLALIVGLALCAAAVWWAQRTSRRAYWPALLLIGLLLGAGRWAFLPADLPATQRAIRPSVGVLSGLPLYGSALAGADDSDLVRDAARKSPLWQALESRFDLRPLDHLDPVNLAQFKQLLLAQPRQLAPQELVALDAWVRGGGHALILADPLLHWPDARPLGDAGRPPLTSLLDPLLIHWGLRLDPADHAAPDDLLVRRILSNGVMIQLIGSSRFARTGRSDARCRLDEAALIAYCMVGAGSARLVADADWINDSLWTLDPTSPHARAFWVSDALPALTAWLQPGIVDIDSAAGWLVDQNRLISGLRWALIAMLLLAAGRAWAQRPPMSSHASMRRNRSKNGT